MCVTLCSSWRPSEASGGGGPKLHSPEGNVAFPDAGEATRSDPRLPGSLCARGKRRVPRPAPHQGRHAGRRPGTTVYAHVSTAGQAAFGLNIPPNANPPRSALKPVS